MRRLKPVTKFKSYTNHALADQSQGIHDSMVTNSGTFTGPPVTMSDFQTGIDAYRLSIVKWGNVHNHGSKADHVAMLDNRAAVEEIIRNLSDYVDGIAAGSESIILSAGMVPSLVPTPYGVLPAPQNLRSLFTKHTQEEQFRLRWTKVTGAVAYQVYASVDSLPENKEFVMTVRSTFAVFELPNCPSLTLRYFWVQAVGGESGLGDLSDVCAARNK